MTKIEKIAQRNGIATIKLKLGEEARELVEAVYNNDHDNIIEEVADVFIVAMQYVKLLDVEDELKEVYEQKIKRTMERLGIK